MLEDSLGVRSVEKRVRLETEKPGLKAFLAVILQEWHFEICRQEGAGVLLVAEEGTVAAAPDQQVVWLSSSAYAASDRLRFPLVLTELYILLERWHHNPPRRHLRVALDLPAEVAFADRKAPARLASLSDRGCRLQFAAEIDREVPLRLHASLGSRELDLAGRVIYCVPRHDPAGQLYYDLGLVFADIGRAQQDELLDYIVASYFRLARRRLAPAEFTAALPWFHLTDRVRAALELPPDGAGSGAPADPAADSPPGR